MHFQREKGGIRGKFYIKNMEHDKILCSAHHVVLGDSLASVLRRW